MDVLEISRVERKAEGLQLRFLSEIIECGFDGSWLGWWKKWATVRDLELHGFGERRGRRFMNGDHIDHHRRLWNRTIAWGLFISAQSSTLSLSLPSLSYFPSHLALALMEHGDSSKGSRASKEVEGPLAQRRRTDDQAFTGSGRVLNTDGLSTGDLFRIAAAAWAGPSEPVVKKAEEQALADAVAVDVEERADALIKQLEDADRHGVRTYSALLLASSFFCSFV
jgi:hypothetical protein